MSNYNDKKAEVSRSETEESRRSFLKQAGKFAVYTPSAVMLLMKPSFAHMSKSSVGRPEHGSRRGKSDIFHHGSFGNRDGKSNGHRHHD